jgi:endonuclease/exonuclease/phosphatase (EEP) superfamily protein YafD
MVKKGARQKDGVTFELPFFLQAILLFSPPTLAVLGTLAVWWPALDSINQATPVVFVACMAGVVAAVEALSGAFRSIVLMVAIVGLSLTGANLGAERFQAWRQIHGPCGTGAIAVVSHNLWSLNPDPWGTARLLRESGADVLLLQEVRGSGDEVVQLLRRAYPYVARCNNNRWCDLAIMSKRPMLNWRYHQARWMGPHPDIASYVVATINGGPAGPMTVATTHLLHLSDGKLQPLQSRQLIDAMSREDQAGLVLGGDLNITPWTYALKSFDQGFEPRRISLDVPTWPARPPMRGLSPAVPLVVWPLDHIFAGSRWRACHVGTLARTGSDHFAIVATLMPTRGGK